MGRTHIVFSLLLGIIYFQYLGFDGNTVLFFLIVCLAGLIPDIDHPNSIIGRKLKPLSIVIHAIFGHRKLTHSLFFMIALSVIIYLARGFYALPVLIGFISHIIGDMLSREGINPLYPLKVLYVKGFFKVNGIIENLLFLAFLAGIALLILF